MNIPGWIDVTWDAGGSNSYRMGAEGKYDLALAPSHEEEAMGRVSVKTVQAMSDKPKVNGFL